MAIERLQPESEKQRQSDYEKARSEYDSDKKWEAIENRPLNPFSWKKEKHALIQREANLDNRIIERFKRAGQTEFEKLMKTSNLTAFENPIYHSKAGQVIAGTIEGKEIYLIKESRSKISGSMDNQDIPLAEARDMYAKLEEFIKERDSMYQQLARAKEQPSDALQFKEIEEM